MDVPTVVGRDSQQVTRLRIKVGPLVCGQSQTPPGALCDLNQIRKWLSQDARGIGGSSQRLCLETLAFVALPGELFSEYSRWLREASPVAHTVVVSMANDAVGYLPTDEAQLQGGYEPSAAPLDKLERPLLDHARRALAEIG